MCDLQACLQLLLPLPAKQSLMKASIKAYIAPSFLYFFVAIILASGCSKKIIPDKPTLVKTNFAKDSLPVSEIDIPLKINLKPFYEIADKNVATIYASEGWPNDFVVDNCDTRYMYRFKRGPLKFSANGSLLNFGFTGTYVIAGAQRICTGTGSNRTAVTPWSPTCTCGLNEGERRVEIGYKASLKLRNNYSFASGIQRLEPKAVDKCTVCFWGQDITPTVMKQLKEQLDIAGKDLQDSINSLSLRPQFQELWNTLNTSIRLYDAGYLQIHPQKLRISEFYAHNDTLNISVGISAQPMVSLTKPTDIKTIVPDISEFRQREGFNIYIDAVMDYDSLSAILTRQLYKKRIDIDKVNKYIIVEKIDLYGQNNEKIILKLQFSGSASGIMYLTGKPVFEKERKELAIRNLDYDIHTRNVLIKTAKWLFNKKITTELNKYAVFNVAEYTNALITRMNEQVNREWKKGISTAGEIKQVQIEGIYPLEKNLVLRCNTQGVLSIKVDSFEF